MSRLIDADKIEYELGSEDEDIYCKEVIRDAPTAFDLDAVVEKLEEQYKTYYEAWGKTDWVPNKTAYINKAEAFNKAIEIVRGGAK